MISNLVYNKAAAKDVLKARKVYRLKRVKNSLLIVWQNQRGNTCSAFVERKKFVARFNKVRDTAAQRLEVRQYLSAPNWYQVSNDEGRNYKVILGHGYATCQCKDYDHQYQTFGKGYCKHIRAVGLFIVGRSVSLSELVGGQ